jgi:tetratricopeptide (TPR) repeat protein
LRIRTTLLEIIEINREALMLSSNSALHLLHLIHKNYDNIADEECVMSLSLNDSIAKMIFHADHAGAVANSREVLAAYPRSEYAYYTARHLALIGRCLTLSGQFAAGEEALHRAMTKIKPLKDGSREMIKINADILHDLAMNNDMSQGSPGTSMRYLEKAIDMLEDTDLVVRKGICLMGLGNINYGQGEVEPALEHYLRSSQIFEDEANLFNLANVSSNIGLCYTDLGKLEVAESHLIRSLHLRKNLGNPDQIAISYHNLSRLYDNMGDIEKALINMLACRDQSRNSTNKHIYNIAIDWIEKCSLRESDLLDSSSHYQYGIRLKVA